MDDDLFLPCCECCAHFRRHPESGAGLCLQIMSTREAATIRDSAMRASNARNRCAHLLPRARYRQRSNTHGEPIRGGLMVRRPRRMAVSENDSPRD